MTNLRDRLIEAITTVYVAAPGNQMAKVVDVADAVYAMLVDLPKLKRQRKAFEELRQLEEELDGSGSG